MHHELLLDLECREETGWGAAHTRTVADAASHRREPGFREQRRA